MTSPLTLDTPRPRPDFLDEGPKKLLSGGPSVDADSGETFELTDPPGNTGPPSTDDHLS